MIVCYLKYIPMPFGEVAFSAPPGEGVFVTLRPSIAPAETAGAAWAEKSTI